MKNTRGQAFSYNSIQHLLNNRRYIGEFRYRDTVIPDGIPAIVPQDLFDRVQEKLAKNKKAPARHKAEDDYLLTTKLFFGCCGSYMCGESGTSHTGKVHHFPKKPAALGFHGDPDKEPLADRRLPFPHTDRGGRYDDRDQRDRRAAQRGHQYPQ